MNIRIFKMTTAGKFSHGSTGWVSILFSCLAIAAQFADAVGAQLAIN
jgi:hypothetical protein